MKNTNFFKSGFALIVTLLFVVGCAATNTASNGKAGKKGEKNEAYDPTGTWEYTVDSPTGATSGELVISGNSSAYTAALETDQFGTLEISSVEFEGTAMTGSIEVMGNVAEIECNFEGDTFTGVVYFGEDALEMQGKRVSK